MTSCGVEPDGVPLVVRDVRLDLAGRTVLDGVSLSVDAGEVVGLIGRNGAGKSSLLHVVAGLRRPASGGVRVAGHGAGSPGARTAMTVVLQDVEFPVTVRVGELLRHVARHYPRADDPSAVAERLGLTGVWRRQAGGLSGGERRKVAVACALLSRPALIVLDEPFAGLDATTSASLWQVLSDAAGHQTGVLLSSHELDDVQQRADRIVVLDAGRVVAVDSPRRFAQSLALGRVGFRTSTPPALDLLPSCEDAVRGGDRWSLTTHDPDRLVVELVRSGTPFTGLVIERLPLGAAVDAFLSRLSRDLPSRPMAEGESCPR